MIGGKIKLIPFIYHQLLQSLLFLFCRRQSPNRNSIRTQNNHRRSRSRSRSPRRSSPIKTVRQRTPPGGTRNRSPVRNRTPPLRTRSPLPPRIRTPPLPVIRTRSYSRSPPPKYRKSSSPSVRRMRSPSPLYRYGSRSPERNLKNRRYSRSPNNGEKILELYSLHFIY